MHDTPTSVLYDMAFNPVTQSVPEHEGGAPKRETSEQAYYYYVAPAR